MMNGKHFLVAFLVVHACHVDSLDASTQIRKRRISEEKCDEYKEIYRYIRRSPLPYPHNKIISSELKCPVFFKPLIFGGRDAKINEYPHMVSLLYRSKSGEMIHNCGGTLISENYVLTAGHCLETSYGPPIRVLLGDILLKPPTGGARAGLRFRHSQRKEISIERIISHPNFDPKVSLYNDIGLIELTENVVFNKRPSPPIRPACLPQPGQVNLQALNVTATGWGRISEVSELQNHLQSVELKVVEQQICNTYFKRAKAILGPKFPAVTEDQICAGSKGKDTCAGDSGGPITISKKEMSCMPYVVGVTSFGVTSCGRGLPAVYTKVDRYLDWIEGIVWRNRT